MSDRDEYARVRDELIEGDPIALVDELLELRKQVAGRDYEYGVLYTEIDSGKPMDSVYWGTEESTKAILDSYNETGERVVAAGGRSYFTGEIVKRRKAGKPGKVEKA